MRNFGAVIFFLVASLIAFAAPSLAQSATDLRVCAGVDLLTPADGAVLDPGYRANFTWDSEPRGTVTREWVSVRVDADDEGISLEDAVRAQAEPRSHKAFARGRPGIYAWAVIFYDANGNPICMSESQTYVVLGSGFASLSGAGGDAAAVAKAALGRYIIRLSSGSNTFYNGPANRQVASDNYSDTTDADNWKALGYSGLEIYGSQKNNKITGSNLSDLIQGGNESCTGPAFGQCTVGDELNGGDGNDIIVGGNESCSAGIFGTCAAGDIINGGNGSDTITGGNENCVGFCATGDVITGGDGSDFISGGNETCSGICIAGDAITGNLPLNVDDGDPDQISGGTGTNAIFTQPGDVVVP